ncbi:ComF family protein [Diaphorobacter sp. HDW4A]|uniref:phosphoribosyltransferase family protein n=1 Tax=Diaphorobacter sp. HDW4A TaxID=2714924 RepID=UPI00140CE8CC|nr:phosphoribosyltransferase family protein [Diaphorobacter sp. HDW4A]QIL83480.1 ComF family protein [Diaphorobacter sp. HDW4A]
MHITSENGNSALQRLRRHLRHIFSLLPSQCAVCHGWPAARICMACVGRFVPLRHRCRTCALPVAAGVSQCGECLLHPPALDACCAALDYAYPWADLIAQFKFPPCDPGWAADLGRLLTCAAQAAPFVHEAELVIPVPLSLERLTERGFNQSLLLARQLNTRDKIRSDLLLRVIHSPAQSQLSRAQRLRNLRASFAVDPLRAHQLRGRRVLLVDDVMTTGATLHTAALALRRAGAAEVRALVLARTA